MSRIGRFFSLFSIECSHPGCESAPTHFGYCKAHYEEQITLRHERLQQAGKTREKPPCFDSEDDWAEYEVFSMDGVDSCLARPDPCRDCTPEYRTKMEAEKRCNHPETVFILRADRKNGGLEGINAKKFGVWEQACQGQIGQVVQLPTVEARRKVIHEKFKVEPKP